MIKTIFLSVLETRFAKVIVSGLSVYIGLQIILTSTVARADSAILEISDGLPHTSTGQTWAATGDSVFGIWVYNAGSSLTGTDLTVTTNGNAAIGVYTSTSGSIDLNGGTITTSGTSSPGIQVGGGGATTNDAVFTGTELTVTAAGSGLINNGSSLTLSNSTITSTGAGLFSGKSLTTQTASTSLTNINLTSGGIGAHATLGAMVNITNSSIETLNNSGYGVYAVGGLGGARSSITVDSTDIITHGTSAYGALANQGSGVGGLVVLQNSTTITTSGTTAHGVSAQFTGSEVQMTGGSITTTGTSASGTFAYGQGDITIDGTTIKTGTVGGTGGNGLYARFLGTIEAADVTATTLGNGAYGGYAFQGAIVQIDQSTIRTKGDASYGLISYQIGTSGPTSQSAQLTATDSTVITSGAGSYGAVANDADSVLTLNNTDIYTGVKMDANGNPVDSGDVITTDPAAFVASGSSNASGLMTNAGGHITATDTTITTFGTGAHGIYATGGTSGSPNVVSMTGGSITTQAGDSIHAEGAVLNLSLQNLSSIQNGGTVLSAVDNGGSTHSTVNLTASAVTLVGNVAVGTDNTANMTLANTSFLTGSTQNLTVLSLDATSQWNVTGDSTISQTLTNAGRISFQHTLPSGFSTLTLHDYTGNGGTITLNTYLEDDTSPSDQIIVDGGLATGTTALIIVNASGSGAYTTANGIKIVDTINSGSTSSDAFHLGSPVHIGAYNYQLFYGGIGVDTGDGDWYLRATGLSPVTDVYSSYPHALIHLAQTVGGANDTLEQRVGQRLLADQANKNIRAPQSFGAWGRVIGQVGRYESKEQTQTDEHILFVQGGYDSIFYSGAEGTLISGIMTGFGQSTLNISSADETGKIGTADLGIYNLGANLTWYSSKGFYADAIGQLSWYRSDLASTDDGSLTQDHKGFGYTLGLEAGQKYRVTLSKNNAWTFTPQVQLAYTSNELESFTDPLGANIRFDRIESLRGRIGLKLSREFNLSSFQERVHPLHFYGIINIYHEFKSAPRTYVDTIPTIQNYQKTWSEVGSGFSYGSNGYSVYAQGSYNAALKGFGSSHEVRGNIGVKIKF